MDTRIAARRSRIPPKPSFFRRHLSTIFGLALLAILIHNVFGAHGFIALRRMRAEAAAIEADRTRLSKENQKLSEQVKSLKSDPVMIERIAREELGLARDREQIFKIPPPADKK